MLDQKPLLWNGQGGVDVARPQKRERKSLWTRGELLIVCTFIAVSSYLTVKLALQTGRLAEFNTQHERSITVINEQIKDQADQLERFGQSDRRVLQSLHETSLRNGRIEARLARIEDDDMTLKRANARILANEQKLREQLHQFDDGIQPTTPGTFPSTTSLATPPPAIPDHQHKYSTSLLPPRGTVTYRNALNEEIWLISRGGKQEQLRPIEKTRLGYRVHNLTDGKDYIMTPEGHLLANTEK